MKAERSDDDGVLGRGETARLESTLIYLARRKFQIPRDVAIDIVQSAILTFLQVKSRYPKPDEHLPILIGIFRNKCREHIEVSVRAGRRLDTLKNTAESRGSDIAFVRTEATMGGGVLGEIVDQEEGRRILAALATLRPQAREMFHLITVERLSRKELMQRFGLNKNTLDSRLHTYRKELQKLLDRRGAPV